MSSTTLVEKTTTMNELLRDNAFLNRYNSVQTVEEYQSLFAEHGIELSTDEMVEIYQNTAEAKSELDKRMASDELSETDLDSVAGGIGVLAGCLVLVGFYILGRIVFKYIIK